MTTLPPIQPRPILCKAPTNSSPVFLLQTSSSNNGENSSSTTNVNLNQLATISLPTAPLSSYEEFLRRLKEFHRCRQTTFRSLPTIAGQIIDLQALYTTVVGEGGWEKVNDRQLWPKIAHQFGIDSSCLNGTQALKNIYIRYLYAFEKISNGENIDSHEDDDEDSKRRTASQLQRVPQSYNHSQHVVSDALRAQYGLFRDFVQRNEYEKIELALLGGFPNELTFTLNTLLLLSSSNNSSTTFHLHKCPRVLEILYRHIGLFLPSDSFYKLLDENLWSKHLNYRMDKFWIDACEPKIVKQLLNVDADRSTTEIDEYFNLKSYDNDQQQELRIEQIVMILRNLSFDRNNAMFLLDTLRSTSSMTYIFLLLLSHCQKKIEFEKYAWDIWANLASFMHLRLVGDDEARLFRQLISQMLNGNFDSSNESDEEEEEFQQDDRLKIIRALEIVSHLAQAGNDNGIYLIDFIDVMVNRLIHVSDILVLVHTLECLYQLSELGEQLCDAILKVHSSTSIITTLIDLLTIEARSFSSQTIKTIKIVEMSSGPVLLPSYHQPPPPPPSTQSVTMALQQQQQQQQQTQSSQSVVVISTSQQNPTQHQSFTIENLHQNTNKLVIQQHAKPMTVASVIASGNLLAVATPSANATPIIVSNANQSVENKRKHDSISETIAAVVNGTTSSNTPVVSSPSTPQKRPRPSRPRPTPTKTNSVVPSTPSSSSTTNPRLITSSSIDDDTSSMESNQSTSNSIQSAMADLLDRCSSPPAPIDPFENEIRQCLTELTQRVATLVDDPILSSATIVYNPVPSPVFKRKNDEQAKKSKTDDQSNKKRRNRSLTKKATTETTSVMKKEEPIEQECPDVKPTIIPTHTPAASVVPPPVPPSAPTLPLSSDYICEWENCRKGFPTARAVFHHTCSAHVKYMTDFFCLWHGCDRIRRQKWALISHLQERHCSEAAFRQAKLKAANPNPNVMPQPTTTTTAITTTTTTTTPTTNTGTVGYAPDAAWLAVRRHMQVNSFDDLVNKGKEGPLTKSIRLTAALILRNIARHSSIGKQNLRQYEQLMANLALEASEASHTLSSCLFELYN